MFKRLTDRARMAMAFANQEAARLKHDFMGCEHILLGVLDSNSSIAVAALHNLHIDVQVLRNAIEKHLSVANSGTRSGKRPFSSEAKAVIEAAIREGHSLRHEHIGTEHLLLGLLHDNRVAQMLAQFDLGLDTVRDQVKELVSQLAPTELAQRHSSYDSVRRYIERPKGTALSEDLRKSLVAYVEKQQKRFDQR